MTSFAGSTGMPQSNIPLDVTTWACMRIDVHTCAYMRLHTPMQTCRCKSARGYLLPGQNTVMAKHLSHFLMDFAMCVCARTCACACMCTRMHVCLHACTGVKL